MSEVKLFLLPSSVHPILGFFFFFSFSGVLELLCWTSGPPQWQSMVTLSLGDCQNQCSLMEDGKTQLCPSVCNSCDVFYLNLFHFILFFKDTGQDS